ncbi:TAF5-like RNA polymerase II p300/CBP-associated factor-associated factor 65 kDa subunit 5L [Tetranychus urticae]|uniref:Uncharacterized protein n=1 Tax=Tetranychus urticae TaxID=32264 RepID=T1KD83_TETUR|nr:TAF5-like RNA polymerase II p300/CBP-associated factor-associated factor 65 kDa subunit 5L [Tetranychus urticae]
MKKSRDDQLNAFVNYYLEKRNYFINHQNKSNKDKIKKRGLSIKEMITSSIVDNCCQIFPIKGQFTNRDTDFDFLTTNNTNKCENHHDLSSTSLSPDQEEENLEKAFDQLQRLPPCIPGPCIGYLEGCNPCTVDIRQDIKYFAAGFDNSEINLWSLTALGFKTQKSYSNQQSSILSNPLRLALESDVNNANSETSPHRLHTSLTGDKTLSGASILRGHYGPVYGLNFVANSHLISCSEDTTIRLWDLNSCKNKFVYSGHLYPVWCIDSSPLELYFVSGSRDTTARLWNYERLHPIRIFAGHILDVDVVKFHPNAAYIATGSSDKTIRLWELKSGQVVRLLEGHKATVTSLAFSPDGKYLVSGGDDCAIKVWDLRTTKGPLASLTSHRAPVNDVCFNGDGSVFISASSDRTVKYWDFQQLKETNTVNKYLLHSTPTDFSLIKLKMLPHNVIYIHGQKL